MTEMTKGSKTVVPFSAIVALLAAAWYYYVFIPKYPPIDPPYRYKVIKDFIDPDLRQNIQNIFINMQVFQPGNTVVLVVYFDICAPLFFLRKIATLQQKHTHTHSNG